VLVLVAAVATADWLTPIRPHPGPARDLSETHLWWRRLALASSVGFVLLVTIGAVYLIANATHGISPVWLGLVKPPPPPPPPFEVTAEQAAHPWPRFRGPMGNGLSRYTNVPSEWNALTGKNVLWKAAIDLPGRSSPVVYGNRVFVTGGEKKDTALYCFDTAEGRLMWKKPVSTPESQAAPVPKVYEDRYWAVNTPATDGQRVYCAFPTGDVAAFDFEGNEVWAVNLDVRLTYGYASSLDVADGLVTVLSDREGSPRLIALKADTGQVAYEAERTGSSDAWTSPVIVPYGKGNKQVVGLGDPFVIAHDLATGKELWRSEVIRSITDVSPSPAYAAKRVYTIMGQTAAFDVEKVTATGGTVDPTWENLDAYTDIPSTACDGNVVVACDGFGMLFCIDANSGETRWDLQVSDVQTQGSPSIVGNLIYQPDDEGVMYVVRMGDEPEKIAENPLGEPLETCPAFQDGRIYLRSFQTLYCIGKKK
jgi:outer membrane protein assembly factor BamB